MSPLYRPPLEQHLMCRGTLPVEWASANSLASLTTLSLINTSIEGTLPDAWAGRDSQAGMPNLQYLWLGDNPGIIGEQLFGLLVGARFIGHDCTQWR